MENIVRRNWILRIILRIMSMFIILRGRHIRFSDYQSIEWERNWNYDMNQCMKTKIEFKFETWWNQNHTINNWFHSRFKHNKYRRIISAKKWEDNCKEIPLTNFDEITGLQILQNQKPGLWYQVIISRTCNKRRIRLSIKNTRFHPSLLSILCSGSRTDTLLRETSN